MVFVMVLEVVVFAAEAGAVVVLAMVRISATRCATVSGSGAGSGSLARGAWAAGVQSAEGEAAAGGETGGQAVLGTKLWSQKIVGVHRALSREEPRCSVLGGASARRARGPRSAGRWRRREGEGR